MVGVVFFAMEGIFGDAGAEAAAFGVDNGYANG
jgi:hypothetical protein